VIVFFGYLLKRCSALVLVGCAFWVAASAAAEPAPHVARSTHVEATLLAEVAHVQPGTPFWVGVQLRHDPHWHTYWRNPGDSGLETTLNWTLPEGFEAGAIVWPYPERIVMEPLVTFGYERDIVLMTQITPPAGLTADEVTLAVDASWLECKEECLPGFASLALTLPVADETPVADADRAALFSAARAEWPIPAGDWSFAGQRRGRTVTVQVTPPVGEAATIEAAQFFVAQSERLAYLPPQNWRSTGAGYAFDVQFDERFEAGDEPLEGVLVSESGWRGAGSERAMAVSIPLDAGAAGAAADAVGGLGTALLFAFLGGLILNLMPCVFPVISIKVMGFMRHAEEDHAAVWKHGLVFALGVLVSFWILAGALIALRAGGEQLGWGFHLQSPVFLFFMAVLFFVLALNLFGVFEVGAGWLGVGQSASGASSWAGSFFSGALATVIATPCTAPFMGAALGYALTLSAFESLLIFTFLGLGMASPYMLLAARPTWLAAIPKPGAWMETLKQSLGWLLMATVVWLVWVLNLMAGGAAVVTLFAVLFLFGLAGWVLGRWGAIHRPFGVRLTAKLLAAVLMLGGLGGGLWDVRGSEAVAVDAGGAAGGSDSRMPWQAFSPERLAELRAAGTPVFVNFTAAWCLSCQVNERVAFSSPRVQQAFAERGIIPMKADWTSYDSAIGEILSSYGRNSVPFYLLFPGKGGEEPQALPELLTPGIVLEAVAALDE
jgi:thiol:disulfide interchange protein/DsbC/DsbD-like thiol-disulfide interchange protein